MENEKEIEKIDAYLLGLLSEEEHLLFEDQMDKDPDLRNAVDLQSKIISAMKQYEERRNFFNILDEIETETVTTPIDQESSMSGPGTVRSLNVQKWIGLAAGLAVLIISIMFIIPKSEEHQLASKYFSPSADLLTPQLASFGAVEGLPDSALNLLREAMVAFGQGEMNRARVDLENFRNTANQNEYIDYLVQFYLGQIYLQNGEYSDAYETLIALYKIPDLPIHSEVTWYLGLSAFGLEKSNEASEILRALRDNPEYAKRVNEILRETR
ncbi:MAG: hypothetical protein KDC53_10500 [Saprospiraceae bacterium]|nr:hypothetical protein [Saprospiraceae bacterium]